MAHWITQRAVQVEARLRPSSGAPAELSAWRGLTSGTSSGRNKTVLPPAQAMRQSQLRALVRKETAPVTKSKLTLR